MTETAEKDVELFAMQITILLNDFGFSSEEIAQGMKDHRIIDMARAFVELLRKQPDHEFADAVVKGKGSVSWQTTETLFQDKPITLFKKGKHKVKVL